MNPPRDLIRGGVPDLVQDRRGNEGEGLLRGV